MSTLEQRVAALEEMAAYPLLAISAEEWTEEQQEEFRKALAEGTGQAKPFRNSAWKVLPQRQPLSKDDIRQLVRECVTVVKPGETLILRCGREWTPQQMREIQDMVDATAEWRGLGFKVLVVPADELGVAEAAHG